jgi:hypothetical protein
LSLKDVSGAGHVLTFVLTTCLFGTTGAWLSEIETLAWNAAHARAIVRQKRSRCKQESAAPRLSSILRLVEPARRAVAWSSRDHRRGKRRRMERRLPAAAEALIGVAHILEGLQGRYSVIPSHAEIQSRVLPESACPLCRSRLEFGDTDAPKAHPCGRGFGDNRQAR